jgi:hypothetical protein
MAFFTKENSLSLPVMILAVEWFFFRNTNKIKDYRVLIFMAIIAIFSLILVISLLIRGDYFHEISAREGHPFTISVFEYWISQVVVVVKYASLVFFPVDQVFDYGMAPIDYVITTRFIGSLILLIIAVFLIIRYHRKYSLVTFGLFWFLITIAPQSIVPRPNLIFEYRAYLGIAGLLFAAVVLYYRFMINLKIKDKLLKYRLVIPALIIILLTIGTYQRNDVWRNEKSLWTDTLSKRPNNARAWVNLGVAYANDGEWQKAIHFYSNAIHIWPDYLQAYNNRGSAYANIENYEKAIVDFQKAITLQKTFQPAWINKIRTLLIQGKNSEAEQNLKDALTLWPENDELLLLNKQIYSHSQP